MNGPAAVFCAPGFGMPIAAGTWRGAPFTKIVRCAWMWKSVCSLLLQLIPSTFWPVAAVAMPASADAFGTGTCSGPSAPGAGGACSVPSVLSAAYLAAPVVVAVLVPAPGLRELPGDEPDEPIPAASRPPTS